MGIVANAQKAIIAAFKGPLKEFLKEVSFDYLTAAGEYDPAADSIQPVYTTVGPLKLPCVRPTVEDLQTGVEVSDLKIIVPGNWLPSAPEVSDRVLIDGKLWMIRKCVGVPGDVIYSVFVRKT